MIIGLTGSIGTGKTTVAKMFRLLGAHVIDADKIVHRLLNKRARMKLRDKVFDDESALKKLCAWIHPLVKKEIASDIKRNKNKKVIIIDAPLLIECGLHKKCERLIVVACSRNKQIERASWFLGISKRAVEKRLQKQMPLRKKKELADFIIDNGGSFNQTIKQAKQIWEELKTNGKSRYRKSKRDENYRVKQISQGAKR